MSHVTQPKKKKILKELVEKKKLKNMNFKNIPQLFLNVLGNQTLQSKTIQTQKHCNPAELSLYRLQNPLIQNLLLLISVNFYYLFFQNSLSLNLKIGTPWLDFCASQLAVHHCSLLFFLFATCNSPFSTVQNCNSMAILFFLFTPWPSFLSLLSISHFKLSLG